MAKSCSVCARCLLRLVHITNETEKEKEQDFTQCQQLAGMRRQSPGPSSASVYDAWENKGNRVWSGAATSTSEMVPLAAAADGCAASPSLSAVGQRRCAAHGVLER